MNSNMMVDDGWVPASCTLPAADQPLRRDEFDAPFSHDLIGVDQPTGGVLRFELRADPDVAARAAGLAAQETGCCSFFTFDLTITEGKVDMLVSTGPAHEPVLAELATRARSKMGQDA